MKVAIWSRVIFRPGEQMTIGHYAVRHDALRVTSDPQKQMITGHVTISEGGKQLGTMAPAKWFFERRPNEPTGDGSRPTSELAKNDLHDSDSSNHRAGAHSIVGPAPDFCLTLAGYKFAVWCDLAS